LYQHWKNYVRSLNYTQFLQVSEINGEPFKQKFRGEYFHSKLRVYEDTFYAFGPAVANLNVGLVFVSDVSKLLLNLFRKERFKAGCSNYFSLSKRNYNLLEGASKSLLENVKLIPGLETIMTELLTKMFPNEMAVKNYEAVYEFDPWHEEAKAYLNKRQSGIYTRLLEDCNNVAVYLPRELANEVAGKIQRPFNQLVYIGTEKLFKKDYLIDLIGHIPPFVLDAVASMKESGIMMRIFDFISSTSKPPPSERTMPFKPTMEGNILVIFIILLGGLGVSAVCFFGEGYKVFCKFIRNMIVGIWCTIRGVYRCFLKFKRRTKVVPFKNC